MDSNGSSKISFLNIENPWSNWSPMRLKQQDNKYSFLKQVFLQSEMVLYSFLCST